MLVSLQTAWVTDLMRSTESIILSMTFSHPLKLFPLIENTDGYFSFLQIWFTTYCAQNTAYPPLFNSNRDLCFVSQCIISTTVDSWGLAKK